MENLLVWLIIGAVALVGGSLSVYVRFFYREKLSKEEKEAMKKTDDAITSILAELATNEPKKEAKEKVEEKVEPKEKKVFSKETCKDTFKKLLTVLNFSDDVSESILKYFSDEGLTSDDVKYFLDNLDLAKICMLAKRFNVILNEEKTKDVESFLLDVKDFVTVNMNLAEKVKNLLIGLTLISDHINTKNPPFSKEIRDRILEIYKNQSFEAFADYLVDCILAYYKSTLTENVKFDISILKETLVNLMINMKNALVCAGGKLLTVEEMEYLMTNTWVEKNGKFNTKFIRLTLSLDEHANLKFMLNMLKTNISLRIGLSLLESESIMRAALKKLDADTIKKYFD